MALNPSDMLEFLLTLTGEVDVLTSFWARMTSLRVVYKTGETPEAPQSCSLRVEETFVHEVVLSKSCDNLLAHIAHASQFETIDELPTARKAPKFRPGNAMRIGAFFGGTLNGRINFFIRRFDLDYTTFQVAFHLSRASRVCIWRRLSVPPRGGVCVCIQARDTIEPCNRLRAHGSDCV